WSAEPSVLIIGNQRTCLAVTEERARHFRLQGARVILLLREHDILHLKATDGTMPQAVYLNLGSEAAVADAAEMLTRLHAKRVEVIDPHPLPRLIELVNELNLPINHWLMTGRVGEAASSLPDKTPLLVPSKAAKAFAKARWPKRKIVLYDWPSRSL